MRRDISPEEVIDVGLRRLRDSMYHCMPGIVQAYNASDQTVDVQPAVNDVRFDTETGERISEPWPVIPHVKILWPKFGGMAVYGEMVQGDKVTLFAFDLDPGPHQANGNQADPADTRRHGGTYWAALPCDITDTGTLPDIGANVVGIGKIGAMTDFAAIARLVDSAVSTIIAAFNTHTHSVPGITSGPSATTSLVPSSTISAQPTSASATVKVSP